MRAAVQEAEIPIDVRPGGEIAIDWLDRLSDDDVGRFGLGGSPRYLLVEFPVLRAGRSRCTSGCSGS